MNRSEWKAASALMCRITTRDKKVYTDKKDMEEDEFISEGGFSIRLSVLPTKVGDVCIWMAKADDPEGVSKQEEDGGSSSRAR